MVLSLEASLHQPCNTRQKSENLGLFSPGDSFFSGFHRFLPHPVLCDVSVMSLFIHTLVAVRCILSHSVISAIKGF